MMQLSFVIAAYNIEAYVAECLSSVLQCAQPGDEILVVNDGSTDGTRALIGQMRDAHPLISIIDKPNGGLSSARNAGLSRACKDYLLFIDGDDVACPDAIHRARVQLDAHGPDILVGDYQEWLDDGRGDLRPSRPRSHQAYQVSTSPAQHLQETFDDCIPCVWTRFFKRSLFAELPPAPFPEWSMYDDLPTTPYLVAVARTLLYVPEPLVKYRIRQGSLTKERTERSCTDMVKAAVHASKAAQRLPSSAMLALSADTLVIRKTLDAIRQCRELHAPTVGIYREIVAMGIRGLTSDHAALLHHLRDTGQPQGRQVFAHASRMLRWPTAYVLAQAMLGKLKAREMRRKRQRAKSARANMVLM